MELSIPDILLTPWKTGIITSAIRLSVFSIISDKELKIDEIASACASAPDRLKSLLDACISLGLLELNNNKYRNTHFSLVYFVEGKRLYVGDFIKILNYESLGWFQLPDLIRGKAKRIIELPELESDHKTFITAMNCIGQLGEAQALQDIVDLSGCKRMTDAGGGSGLYSIVFCQKYPKLHSTILDRKETLEVTKEFIAERPEKKQITLQEGNFLNDPLGDNLDAVLLSDIMYGDDEAKLLLTNAWDSLGQNGKLIVRGYYADPERSGPLFGALFAVKLMVDDPQRKIMTISMLVENVREVGFRNIEVKPLTEYSFVLIANK